jgi:hypothetical protein
MKLIFFEYSQTDGKLNCSYRCSPADFLQRVLIDSPSHELPLGNFHDSG